MDDSLSKFSAEQLQKLLDENAALKLHVRMLQRMLTIGNQAAQAHASRHFAVWADVDFVRVTWGGEVFDFSDQQAAIVASLWATLDSATVVTSDRIGRFIGAPGACKPAQYFRRRRDGLVKQHSAWNRFIKSDGKGRFWLAPPRRIKL